MDHTSSRRPRTLSQHYPMKKSIKLFIYLYFILLQLWIIDSAPTTTNRKGEPIRPGRKPDVDRFDEVYAIVRNTFLIALAPVVFMFIHSVIRDPLFPVLVKKVFKNIQKKFVENLSGGSR